MQPLWDFLANNKDTVDTLLKILAFLGLSSIAGAIGWIIRRWWLQRVRIDVQAFEIIKDRDILLPKLLRTENNNSPLAAHNITYQPRDPDPEQDTQGLLRSALNKNRYLLVTAPSGYGKTREAGMLAESLMREGYRVIRVSDEWLDIPRGLPKELEGDRSRILIFLDDLNFLFRSGGHRQSPRAEQIPLISQPSYHDRLLAVLNAFETMCEEDEIRIIATARSDDWDVLDFGETDDLWKRFTRIELTEPKIESIIKLITDTSAKAELKTNPGDFEAIARANDGSYRNIILNLQNFKFEGKEVTKDNFQATQQIYWKEKYERLFAHNFAIRYVYDAVDIAKQVQVDLYIFIIESLAENLWGGNLFQRIIRRHRISNMIGYLTERIRILPKYKHESFVG